MMMGFVVLLAGAALGFGLARLLGLPATPLLLVAGFLLAGLGWMPSGEVLTNVIVLGVSFLLFAAGVDLDVQRVGQHRQTALRVGLGQFTVLTIAGLLTALALGFALAASIYLALALAASSTLVVVRLLQQRGQMFEPFGRLVLGVLLLQDLLIIALAPVLIGALESPLAAAAGLVLTCVLIGLAYALQRWVIPYVVLKWSLEGESLLLLTLAILFGFIGMGFLAGLPMITGAFLAGFSLSSFPVNGLVREQLTPLTDFFLSIFFIALGGFIIIPTAHTLMVVLVLVTVVIVVTVPLVTYLAERAGFTARAAIESGLLLSQTSELSIIIGLIAFTSGAIDLGIFSVIVLVTAVTMMLTPFLATRRMSEWLLRMHPARVREQPEAPPEDHILLLGVGQAGMPLLETLHFAGFKVFVVDEDPAVVRYLQENEVPSLRGDGSDPAVLQAAGARRARVIISMMRPRDGHALLEQGYGDPVFMRVFTDEDAEEVERLGGIPIRYADVAADAFLEWFEKHLVANVER
jgi:Kef-type K+ transport system membrane component KefB